MIGYITGTPLFTQDQATIIDVQGLGYKVYTTETTQNILLAKGTISLFIESIIREQAFDLYGFESKNQLYFFQKLIAVSGIGPKSALVMIGLASTDTLYQAIINHNIDFLVSVPGIGKKTAERMCIELSDKLKDYQAETDMSVQDGDHDVIDALVALGYSSNQAYKALSDISGDITETNDRIKAALNQLS